MYHIKLSPKWSAASKRIALLAMVAVLSACPLQGLRQEQAVQPLKSQISVMEETIAQQRRRIMELELGLLAKQSEVEGLSSIQEETVHEVVRLKAKLRSRHSKAEIVANLVEAKLALQGLQSVEGQEIQAESLKRARQYIAMSEAELENGNYEGASYLVGQARASLAAADALPDEQLQSNPKMTAFAAPVAMRVRQRSNVRAGPGTDKKVLYQLKAGTAVEATGYRRLWVQVKGSDDSRGWIHYSLLQTTP